MGLRYVSQLSVVNGHKRIILNKDISSPFQIPWIIVIRERNIYLENQNVIKKRVDILWSTIDIYAASNLVRVPFKPLVV